MESVQWVFLMGLVATVAAATTVFAAVDRGWEPLSRPRRATDRLAGSIGRGPTSILVILVGSAFTLVVTIGVGRLLQTHTRSDRSMLEWWARRYDSGSEWFRLQSDLTTIGGIDEFAVVVGVLGLVLVILGIAVRPEHWWVPVPLLALAYALQRVTEQIVAETVGRDGRHELLGGYPSGGVTRVIVAWGVATVIVRMLVADPRVVRLAVLVAAVLAYIEAYSRIYLLKHWTSDLVGSLLLGGGLVAVCALLAGLRTSSVRRMR